MRSASIKGVAKASLDLVATIAVIAVCFTILWKAWANESVTAAPPPAPVTAKTPKTPVPPPGPVVISDGVAVGATGAKVALIVYSDFQCPFCGILAKDTLPELHRRYVETGALKVVFRHLPLESIHPDAIAASQAAECADEQGSFWPMHDLLFANQRRLDASTFAEHARALGLSASQFSACLTRPIASRIRSDLEGARALGITATPTMLLGTIRSDGLVAVAKRIEGAQRLKAVAQEIDALVGR